MSSDVATQSVWPMETGDVMRVTLDSILPGGKSAPITIGEIRKTGRDLYEVQLQIFEFHLAAVQATGELTETSFTGRPTKIWRESTVQIVGNARSPWVILRNALNAALRPQSAADGTVRDPMMETSR